VPVQRYNPNVISRLGDDPMTGQRLVVTDERFFQANGMSAASGRVELLSNPELGSLAVLGSVVAKDLNVPQAGSDISINVNGRFVPVVGVLNPSGDPLLDGQVYFNAGAAPLLTRDSDASLIVLTGPGYGEPLGSAIPELLSPGSPSAIQVSTIAQLASLQQGIASDLSGLLSVIGLVILVLSALSAATVMFLSVQHRSAEIALRRAMGATRASIWRLFTYEGILISAAGAILGTAVGILIAFLTARANGWPLSIGLEAVLAGLGVGLLAGMVASAFPALYAARREPATILRAA
jgi:macrolide transport system ATP-binding/permease protein